jgi:hypothetical protein
LGKGGDERVVLALARSDEGVQNLRNIAKLLITAKKKVSKLGGRVEAGGSFGERRALGEMRNQEMLAVGILRRHVHLAALSKSKSI